MRSSTACASRALSVRSVRRHRTWIGLNWLQFLFVVEAAVIKQPESKCCPQNSTHSSYMLLLHLRPSVASHKCKSDGSALIIFGQNFAYQMSPESVNGCRNIAIYQFFFKMSAVRHLGFAERILGPSTKCTRRKATILNE